MKDLRSRLQKTPMHLRQLWKKKCSVAVKSVVGCWFFSPFNPNMAILDVKKSKGRRNYHWKLMKFLKKETFRFRSNYIREPNEKYF